MREADSRKGNPVAFLRTHFHENERGRPDACDACGQLSDENFNCANVEGFTPLHYAAGEGNLQVTKYLVEACQCDPEFPDNLGLTPGFCAVLQGRKEVAEYLLQVRACDHCSFPNK